MQGGGLGLRVAFLTAAKCPGKPRPVGALGASDCPLLTVHYGHALLASVPLAAAVRGAASGFLPVVVEYSWAGLHVSHNGTDLISRGELAITGWAPQPGWSFGLGARCGAQTDVHELRAISLQLGPEVDPTLASLRVSLNAQQFVPVPQGFRYLGLAAWVTFRVGSPGG